jgi:hypothetical protein
VSRVPSLPLQHLVLELGNVVGLFTAQLLGSSSAAILPPGGAANTALAETLRGSLARRGLHASVRDCVTVASTARGRVLCDAYSVALLDALRVESDGVSAKDSEIGPRDTPKQCVEDLVEFRAFGTEAAASLWSVESTSAGSRLACYLCHHAQLVSGSAPSPDRGACDADSAGLSCRREDASSNGGGCGDEGGGESRLALSMDDAPGENAQNGSRAVSAPGCTEYLAPALACFGAVLWHLNLAEVRMRRAPFPCLRVCVSVCCHWCNTCNRLLCRAG